MIDFPIIDAHVHLYDPRTVRYSWLDPVPALDRKYTTQDYLQATSGISVEAIVVAEIVPDPGENLHEASWVAGEAEAAELVGGLIASVPLEKGDGIQADLDALADHAILRAVRRGTQEEPDPDYCTRPGFVRGVQLLGARGLVCDVCVFHHQLPAVIALVRSCPNVQFVLDHLGKPGIKAGLIEAWRRDIAALASLPNVVCKISGAVNEADHGAWTPEQLRPYVEFAIEQFGFGRVMYGGDWPVMTLASTYKRWFDTVDWITEPCSDAERRQLFHDTAARIYSLQH